MTISQSDASVDTVPYNSPLSSKVGVYLAEHFDDPTLLGSKWILSNSKKPDVDEELAKYDGKLLIIIYQYLNVIGIFFFVHA